MQDPIDDLFDLDQEPTSEIRAVDSTARRLLVDCGMRGKAAEAALVVVMKEDGSVVFEGSPAVDGCVEVAFESTPAGHRVSIRLETARCHRQAEVVLGDGWTLHVFPH
jgi:hypothetical protein